MQSIQKHPEDSNKESPGCFFIYHEGLWLTDQNG